MALWSAKISVPVVLCILIAQSASSQDNGYNLILEHSFGDGDFQKRGEIHFQNIRGEQAAIHEQSPLTPAENNQLEELSKAEGIYRIRIKSKLPGLSTNAESEDAVWLTSFTYAKLILEANMCDDITIHSDGIGNLVAINISPSMNNLVHIDEPGIEFTTNVTVVLPSIAPIPDTHGYLNKLEEERKKKEKSAKEPTSFFGKYWMYILPVVVFMMISQNAGQQQG